MLGVRGLYTISQDNVDILGEDEEEHGPAGRCHGDGEILETYKRGSFMSCTELAKTCSAPTLHDRPRDSQPIRRTCGCSVSQFEGCL